MNGIGRFQIEATLVPRHYAIHLDATLDGTAAMQLLMILEPWDGESAGGLVGALRDALTEANGGKEIELPQPVVVPDAPPDEEEGDGDEDGGTKAKPKSPRPSKPART
jgi:hypothetical protein